MSLVDPEKGHAIDHRANDTEVAKFAGQFIGEQLHNGNVPPPEVIASPQRNAIEIAAKSILTIFRDRGLELSPEEIAHGLRALDFEQVKAELALRDQSAQGGKK